MHARSLALCAMTVAMVSLPYSAAQAGSYTFKTLEISGEYESVANAVTDDDIVVGTFNKDGGDHGFVWSKGKYTIADVPADGSGGLVAVNARGVAAGQYYDFSTATQQVYTYDIKTGAETLFPTNSDFYFYPTAIGKTGTTVGATVSAGRKPSRGFADSKKSTKLLQHFTFATGIDDANEIVGFYYKGVDSGFLKHDGKYTLLNAPGAASTSPAFVTPNGIIGGSYTDMTGTEYGFTLAADTYTSYAFLTL